MTSLGSRLSVLFGWAALAVIAVASLFNAQEVVIDEPVALTAWLLGATPALVVGLVLLPWAAGRRDLWRGSRFLVAAFGALLVWSAIRIPGVERCLDRRDGELISSCFPDWVSWVPLAQAAVTAALAWVFVASIPRAQLTRWMAGLAAVILGMSVVALVRALLDPRGFNRLGSGLGGAAVLAVALVIATALLAGRFLEDHRRWLSGVGVVVGLVLIATTFSRAGYGVAALTVVAVLVAGRGGRRRLSGGWALTIGGGLLVVGAVIAVFFRDHVGRMLSLGDPGRAANTATALNFWTDDPLRVLFGSGVGRLWPWFAVDADLVWAPETGMMGSKGIDGELLVNPHSTFLGVLVELGLVGFVLLLLALGGVLVAAWTSRGKSPANLGLIAAAVCVVAFLLDYYLLRNPGVSFVWWCAVFAGLAARATSASGAGSIGGRLSSAVDDGGMK